MTSVRPLISVVMAHHENSSQKYLDLALESLFNSRDVDIECQLMVSTVDAPKLPSDSRLHVHTCPRDITGPRQVNLGHKLSNPKATHFMNANDDLIFSQDALIEMVETLGDKPLMVNPLSNCDNELFYWADIQLEKTTTRDEWGEMRSQPLQLILKPPRSLKREDITGFEDAIMNYPKGNQRVILPMGHLCTYATLYSRETWERVGPYDERYIMGWADHDHSWMAREKGVGCGIVTNAFIFHFGGATFGGDKQLSPEVMEIRRLDKEAFASKWGMDVRQLG